MVTFDPTKVLKRVGNKVSYLILIMEHNELLALLQSFHSIFAFFVNFGLIAHERTCGCGNAMLLKERQNVCDGLIWECPLRSCRKRRSIRAGSFFENSKIPLGQWLYIIFLWSIDISNKQISLLTGISLRTAVTTLEAIRRICSLKILNGNVKLGGRGKTVEIDESMFGHKRKYNRGRVSKGTWVFGMVERDSGRALTFRVPDRSRETLVTRLVQEFVRPGTIIISDKFSPYFNLNNIGYIHLMVNHSKNFVDPVTGAHTNTIEGLWNQVKKKLKRMSGTFKDKLPGYLDEFNWQRQYPGNRFENMLRHIGELYPVN